MPPPKKTVKAPNPSPPDEEEDTRLVVNMPERIHRQLKSRAAAEGKTMRDYVLEMLRERGIK